MTLSHFHNTSRVKIRCSGNSYSSPLRYYWRLSLNCCTNLVALAILFETMWPFAVTTAFVPSKMGRSSMATFLLLQMSIYILNQKLYHTVQLIKCDFLTICLSMAYLVYDRRCFRCCPYYFWCKCKGVPWFNHLSCLHDCLFVFWLIEATLAWTWIPTVDSCGEAFAITVSHRETVRIHA